jgi:hypothetical protein
MCGVTQRVGKSIVVLFHDRGTKSLSGQQHAAAALYPRERPGTHCKEVGGPQSPSGRTESIVLSGIRPRTVVSRYTD